MVELLVMLTALLKVGPSPAAVAPLESSTRLPPVRTMPASPIGSWALAAVLPVKTRVGGAPAAGVKVNEVLDKEVVAALLSVTTLLAPMAVITVLAGMPEPLTPMPTDSVEVLVGIIVVLLLVLAVTNCGVVPSTVIVVVARSELALLV